jgi:hypothetical protein
MKLEIFLDIRSVIKCQSLRERSSGLINKPCQATASTICDSLHVQVLEAAAKISY